jgi:hypothetical protein
MLISPALICVIWHKRNTSHPTHRWIREMVLNLLSRLNTGEGQSNDKNSS